MKESRFIELLNLYVDQQLSAAEAAELEVEIARNHSRRTAYQQYCRMQKACTLLFEKERMQAPASRTLAASLREADRKIIAFPESQARSPRGYYPVGLLAAAACVAFVFVRFSTPGSSPIPASTGQPVAVQRIPESVQPVTISPATPPATNAVSRASFYSVFATRRAQQELADSASTDLAADSAATPVVSYAWMQKVELEPVQSLSSNSLSLQESSLRASEDRVRVLRSRKPVQDTSEMTAFTFQR